MELSPSVHIGVSFAGLVRLRIQLFRFPRIMRVNSLAQWKTQNWFFVSSFKFFCQQSKTLRNLTMNLTKLRDLNLTLALREANLRIRRVRIMGMAELGGQPG